MLLFSEDDLNDDDDDVALFGKVTWITPYVCIMYVVSFRSHIHLHIL